MNRRHFIGITGSAGALLQARGASAQTAAPPQQVYPGVWKFTFGAPEKITPTSTRRYAPAESGFRQLPTVPACPAAVTGSTSRRGTLVSIPLAPNEGVYGLGLQLQSFVQRGGKKRLRVNADPRMDTGDSHAPAPFYVTTNGYGVLVDTARYATFYCGGEKRKKPSGGAGPPPEPSVISTEMLPAAYRRSSFGERTEVLIEVPEAQGVDVYVFAGPTMRQAVQRYNLFSGGGPLPPRWGLGMWYRVKNDYNQEEVLNLASEFRERRIPCDVIGLEASWETRAYSSTFVWSGKFPQPAALVGQLTQKHYRLNLWEHAFTHPTSPLYQPLFPYSGDYEVWGGLVPDFLGPEARQIFADFHEKEHIALGVSGYKLDECDNADFTGNWSFPEISSFPSGADGEQMHCLFGQRYQDTLQSVFEKRHLRTYGLVRSSGALAAPYPYVLYSDLYDHKEFIRGLANAGFSGLLWTPELRNAQNTEDLVRRLQSVALSPMALINAWYIKSPPWKQVERNANNAGRFDPNWEEVEARCRSVMEMRMRLIPYLHAAFVRYHREGLPPFRGVVMDYPDDPRTWPVDNQFMMGESLMVAPAFAGEPARAVYLPAGDWFDFWSGKRYSGKQSIQVNPPLEQIPVFVKAGTILPLAEPTLHTDDPASWRLTVQVYGDHPTPATLYEDDGGWNPALTEVALVWDSERHSGSMKRSGSGRYEVAEWKLMV
ncbi:MAG: glycoside hydrolase family 31 protein [Bryobacteraceae bacterium]|jgi:alpha-D-xyloside xylohydrolase